MSLGSGGEVGELLLARLVGCGVCAPRLLGEYHGGTPVALWVQQGGLGRSDARRHEGIAQFRLQDGRAALELPAESGEPLPTLAEGSSSDFRRSTENDQRLGVFALVQLHHVELLNDIRDNGELVAQCTHFDGDGESKLLVRFYELSLPR